jgi:hypothetical protein
MQPLQSLPSEDLRHLVAEMSFGDGLLLSLVFWAL